MNDNTFAALCQINLFYTPGAVFTKRLKAKNSPQPPDLGETLKNNDVSVFIVGLLLGWSKNLSQSVLALKAATSVKG